MDCIFRVKSIGSLQANVWFVLDQQPSELFVGIDSFHTKIPQFDAGIVDSAVPTAEFKSLVEFCRMMVVVTLPASGVEAIR